MLFKRFSLGGEKSLLKAPLSTIVTSVRIQIWWAMVNSTSGAGGRSLAAEGLLGTLGERFEKVGTEVSAGGGELMRFARTRSVYLDAYSDENDAKKSARVSRHAL